MIETISVDLSVKPGSNEINSIEACWRFINPVCKRCFEYDFELVRLCLCGFPLHYSSLHTVKVSGFVSDAVGTHKRHIVGLDTWMLVKLWDIYLQYYTLGGRGRPSHISTWQMACKVYCPTLECVSGGLDVVSLFMLLMSWPVSLY